MERLFSWPLPSVSFPDNSASATLPVTLTDALVREEWHFYKQFRLYSSLLAVTGTRGSRPQPERGGFVFAAREAILTPQTAGLDDADLRQRLSLAQEG